MTRALALSKVKEQLPRLIRGVQKREEEVVVTKNGQPAAVILNYLELLRMRETLDVLSDKNLMGQIKKSRLFFKKRKKGLSFEDVFGELLILKKKKKHS